MAAAGDFDEARIELPRLGIAEPLDLDCVLPTVAEVISQRYTSFFVPMSSRMSPSRALSGVEKVAPIRLGIERAPADADLGLLRCEQNTRDREGGLALAAMSVRNVLAVV